MKKLFALLITVVTCALLLVSCELPVELPFDISGASNEYTVTYYDGDEV